MKIVIDGFERIDLCRQAFYKIGVQLELGFFDSHRKGQLIELFGPVFSGRAKSLVQ